jgi:hypothetical protein
MIQTLVKKEYQNESRDQINKTYKTCGCIFISELDIINNILNDKYIQFCKHHIIINTKLNVNKLKPTNQQLQVTNYKLESYLNFGRYKNKSFNYVFENDKLYCYNLAFWKNNNCEYKNININLFIQFIKTQLSINETN